MLRLAERCSGKQQLRAGAAAIVASDGLAADAGAGPGRRCGKAFKLPTKQKSHCIGLGPPPLDQKRPEKDTPPNGAFHHELSRPMRVSWLPANGTMQAAFAAVCVDTEGILPAVKR